LVNNCPGLFSYLKISDRKTGTKKKHISSNKGALGEKKANLGGKKVREACSPCGKGCSTRWTRGEWRRHHSQRACSEETA
jgi:hypothetical protein